MVLPHCLVSIILERVRVSATGITATISVDTTWIIRHVVQANHFCRILTVDPTIESERLLIFELRILGILFFLIGLCTIGPSVIFGTFIIRFSDGFELAPLRNVLDFQGLLPVLSHRFMLVKISEVEIFGPVLSQH